MGFTFNSQPVKPAEHVSPIPFELYAQGLGKMEKDIELANQENQNSYDNLESIPTASPADAKVLQDKLASVRGELSKVSMANLRDPAVKQKINSYYSQVMNDPDIQAIAQRGYTVQSEQKRKKEAESKGKIYISPVLEQAQAYNQKGVYLRDEAFSGDGWNDPEIEKLKGEVLKTVPKIKKQVYKDGRWLTEESYDPESLKSRLQDVYNHPDVQKTLQYQFNNTYKDVDWNVQGQGLIQNNLTSAKQQAEAAKKLLDINPNNPKATQALLEANQHISKYQTLLSNPGKVGENLKRQIMQETLQSEIQSDIDAEQFVSQDAIKADEFALRAQDLKDDMTKELYKTKTDMFGALSKEEQEKFQKNPNDISINWTNAYKVQQENKRKNAAAAFNNPNLTGSELIDKSTYDKWQKEVTTGADPKKPKLQNTDYAKEKIFSLIKDHPEMFPEIPANIIEQMKSAGASSVEINISDGTIEIDPINDFLWDNKADYGTITRQKLDEVIAQIYLDNTGVKPNTTQTTPIQNPTQSPSFQGDSVKQNGVIYYWNPKTQTYE